MISSQSNSANVDLKPINVLLVEDSGADAFLIRELLPVSLYNLFHVSSLSKARAAAINETFDIVLLDLSLEDSFGLDTFLSINKFLPDVPICILTGYDNEEVAIQAIKLGAQDYVQKAGLNEKALIRIIRYSIERDQAQGLIVKSEDRASTAEAFLKLALMASKTGVWSFDLSEGRVTFDAQMLALFDTTDAGVVVETLPQFLELVHFDDRDRIAKALDKAIKDKNEYDSEYKIVWRDGSEHYIAARGHVITDSTGSDVTMAGVCTDITKLVMAQKDALRLTVLEQHEDFIATLTHDLKNPLIGADRMLELFLSGAVGTLNQRQTDLLSLMQESNADMLALIQNLLEVYRYDDSDSPLVFAAVNMKHLADKVIRQLSVLAERAELQFSLNFPEGKHEIFANGIAISRVLRNLVSNAMKFTNAGGLISITGCEMGNLYKLVVQDSGSGIPDEDLTALFQRFSQGNLGKKYEAGTGLGLYLCRQLIKAHGGEITCISTMGVGTSFTVLLPTSRE